MFTIDEKLLRLWLSLRTKNSSWRSEQLISCFGGIEAVYNARLDDYMQVAEMKKAVAIALSDKGLEREKQIISDCRELGINILTPGDEGFKMSLTTLSSPVQVLYTLGTVPDWDSILGIAVVGTRKYSEYGQVATQRLAGELAEKGATIISGMARGIDSFALKSALKTGADVVAVMGCGLDSAYPPENEGLMQEIIKHGCAISEYPPYIPPAKHHFPERNRIMSELSDGVLAVEAPQKSGTLITASLAELTGKTVFAVPGNIFHKNSVGTNNLIKRGAVAVTCAEDILDAFPQKKDSLIPPLFKEEAPTSELDVADAFSELSVEENRIITLLRGKDMHTDEISARTGIVIAKLNPMLTMLELDGYIIKTAGNIYRCNTDK